MPVYSDEETNSDYSDNEVDETQQLSESEDNSVVEEKAKKEVLSASQLLEQYTSKLEQFHSTHSGFVEKEKDFEKERKDYYAQRKKMEKELDSLLKQFNKRFSSEQSKQGKKKRVGNSTGGFNKVAPVPKVLRKYLELDDTELSRSAVNKLLHAKFKAEGFKDGKITTITSKKAAKVLGVTKDYVIEFSAFSKFLAKFYNDEKESASNI